MGRRGAFDRRYAAGDQESDSPGVVRTRKREAGCGLLSGLHDDMLEQVAEAGLDRTLVPAIDIEIVSDRTELRHLVAGFREEKPGAVAIFRTRRVELLQRLEPGIDRGQLALTGTELLGARIAFGPCRRQIR